MNKAIHVEGLSKAYSDISGRRVPVLHDLNLDIAPGEVVAIVGASGSGKSTLLHAIGGLDSFESGVVEIAGSSISGLSEKKLGEMRNRNLGFVYQFHHLLPEFTALENAAMPLIIRRVPQDKAYAAARKALESVGLAERADHLPGQLSGGERQRVAIARAIVTNPKCVLADEPTGNLDAQTAASVFSVFVKLARSSGAAIVIVTHDLSIAQECDRVLKLENGSIQPC